MRVSTRFATIFEASSAKTSVGSVFHRTRALTIMYETQPNEQAGQPVNSLDDVRHVPVYEDRLPVRQRFRIGPKVTVDAFPHSFGHIQPMPHCWNALHVRPGRAGEKLADAQRTPSLGFVPIKQLRAMPAPTKPHHQFLPVFYSDKVHVR